MVVGHSRRSGGGQLLPWTRVHEHPFLISGQRVRSPNLLGYVSQAKCPLPLSLRASWKTSSKAKLEGKLESKIESKLETKL